MRVAIIDHYDSFTHNIDAWLRSVAPQVRTEVIKYDDCSALSALRSSPCPLVLSAGPHSPTEAQPTIDLLSACRGKVAVLGICLGFQIICAWLGLAVRHSRCPQHGRRRTIFRCMQGGLLTDFPMTFTAAAYNSLAVPVRQYCHHTGAPVQLVLRTNCKQLNFRGRCRYGACSFTPNRFSINIAHPCYSVGCILLLLLLGEVALLRLMW